MRNIERLRELFNIDWASASRHPNKRFTTFWISFGAFGIHIKHKRYHTPLFSERYGYTKFYYVGNWGINFFKRTSAEMKPIVYGLLYGHLNNFRCFQNERN